MGVNPEEPRGCATSENTREDATVRPARYPSTTTARLRHAKGGDAELVTRLGERRIGILASDRASRSLPHDSRTT